jgi:two-component system chemotaxis sensor kinase CheA
MQADDKLLKSMQATFRLEMGERLVMFSQHLAMLEDTTLPEAETSEQALAEIRQNACAAMLRELHNLKGAARAVTLPQIEELCHTSETLLVAYQTSQKEAGSGAIELEEVVDLLYQVVTWGDQLLNQLNLGLSLDLPGLPEFISLLQARNLSHTDQPPATGMAEPSTASVLKTAHPERHNAPKSAGSRALPVGDGTIKISGAKLDELLAASTELLVARLRMRQHREEIANLVAETQAWTRQWRLARGSHGRLLQRSSRNAARPTGGRDKDLASLLQFVEVNQQRLKHFESALNHLHTRFSGDVSYLSFVTDQLQFETRRLRLIPLTVVTEELGRTARQLTRDLGKQVQLIVHGAELEVDKKLLDELKAPLLHLLRNALDHGLESPAQRLYQGKPAAGKVSLSFHQADHMIEVEVRDDGAGLDVERIRELIVERGLLEAEAAAQLDQSAVIQYIFHPGFSTRREVSDVSGRGIGLDEVWETVSRLGGSVSVESWPGSGTAFRFSVPNLLVTTEGIAVKCAEQTFVIPIDSVERSVRLSDAQVHNIGLRRYLYYKGAQVELISLAQVLAVGAAPATNPKHANQYIIILRRATGQGRLVAFTVNDLLRNQEVVVKNFSKPLVRVRHISGATIMADGSVALILNPDDLIRTVEAGQVASGWEAGSHAAQGLANPTDPGLSFQPNGHHLPGQRILVVDDSITTRTLEKNILEAAGFMVQTARNGLEALGLLRTTEFDLVISDLEMPEMDGFELTRTIKADQRWLETPVIIVTSLDTAQDKTRGMESGADAYVVKSRFDQQNLLNTVRQLV